MSFPLKAAYQRPDHSRGYSTVRDPKERLEDMLEAIEHIERYAARDQDTYRKFGDNVSKYCGYFDMKIARVENANTRNSAFNAKIKSAAPKKGRKCFGGASSCELFRSPITSSSPWFRIVTHLTIASEIIERESSATQVEVVNLTMASISNMIFLVAKCCRFAPRRISPRASGGVIFFSRGFNAC